MATQSFFTTRWTQYFRRDFQGAVLGDRGRGLQRTQGLQLLHPALPLRWPLSQCILFLSACFALKEPGYVQLSQVNTYFRLL